MAKQIMTAAEKADRDAKKAALKSIVATKKDTSKYVLKNVLGEDMDEKDYFYSDNSPEEKTQGSLVPSYFNKICGFPVEREDLLEVFSKIFHPADNILFYKSQKTEVYTVIVPLKFSEVGVEEDAISGQFQRHAISFINEGSANLDTLKMKLKRVAASIRYSDR
ncbi:MAG: hypothetical protein V4509_00455 [Patescibacteria group bacterium]